MKCSCCQNVSKVIDLLDLDQYFLCEDCSRELSWNPDTMDAEILAHRKVLYNKPKAVIERNTKLFYKQFLPSYTTGISNISSEGGSIHIRAKNKLHHVPIKGSHSNIEVTKEQYETWVNNLNLYKFVQGG